jgi:hypothetical protein
VTLSVSLSVVSRGWGKGLTKFVTRLLGIVGESKVPLPAKEITKKMKERYYLGDSCTFVYQKLRELTPTDEKIPGIRLFCYEDFIANTDNDMKKKLVKKLGSAYGYDGLDWKWDGIQPYFETNSCGNKVIKIKKDDKNFIEIELLPINSEKHQNGIAKMVLVENGSRFTPPLITKQKNVRRYVYSMSRETYIKSIGSRTYLFHTLSNEAENMVSKKKNQIETMDLRSNEVETIRHEIEDIENNRDYWEYSLNLRGLLLYLAGESVENNRIDKTLDSISERDEYIHERDSVVIGVNEDNGEDLFRVWSYRIKQDFPFLSLFSEIKRYLPEKFSAILLKNIALELQTRLEDMNNEDLKYEVTSRYYKGLTNHFWVVETFFTPLILDRTRIEPETRDMIIKYQLEILAYLIHRKQKEVFQLENEQKHYRRYYKS